MIVDSKSRPAELDSSIIRVTCAIEAKEKLAIIFIVDFDFLALMRFHMTVNVMLRENSSFGKLTNSYNSKQLIFTFTSNV